MYHKVLITASSFAHIRSFHLPYLKAFREHGTEVHVACGGAVCQLPDAARLIPLPLEKKLFSPANFRAASVLHRLLREECYDLVITHTSLAACFTRLATNGLRPCPPVIYMCHGYLFDDSSSALRRRALLTAEKTVSEKTDLLLNMNAYDFQLAKKHRLGRRIELVPGVGVDYDGLDASCSIPRDELRSRLQLPQDAFVLFYAAEFSHRKNQAFLIRAMTALPEQVHLVLAGTGELLDFCRKLAMDLQVQDRVHFPGHVSPVSDWYRMADAAVSSSRSEGLPFNIMEAMHFGLPVVSSDVKGNSDLIRHQNNGLLFPYDDMPAYVSCITALLRSHDLAARLGSAAADSSLPYGLPSVFPLVWGFYLSFSPEGEER